MSEEQFLELFKYTGPEVDPGEFNRKLQQFANEMFLKGTNYGLDKAIEIMGA